MNVFDAIKVALGAAVGGLLVYAFMSLVTIPAAEREARAGYVLLSEKTALQSQLDEMQRQRNAAAQSLEEYRKRAVADALTQQKLEAQLEQAIQDDNQNADDGDYRWSDADRLWLCQQRGAVNCSR